MSALLLSDVKEFLNKTDSGDDAEVQAMVDRAEAIIAARVGPLTEVTVTDEVHTGPGPLVLKRWPVISVSSATSDGAAVTDLDLDEGPGVVYGSFGSTRRGISVSYVAGRTSLPVDLEAAVLELVRHLWVTQRVPGTRLRGSGEPDERTLQGVSTYLLPYRVQTLIEPHLKPTLP